MPPANTPIEVPPTTYQRPSSPSSLLPALQRLASPVLDLASTLSLEAEDDVHAQNLAFLRTSVDPVETTPTESLVQQLRNERRRREAIHRGRSISEETRERRIHEARMDQLRQRHDSAEAWSERTITRTRAAYGDGLPSHQSLSDWAPATDTDAEAAIENILSELTQQQPNTHPEILRVLARASVDAEREGRYRTGPSQTQTSGSNSPTHEPSSLRSAAILQSFRRNHRILSRSREFMQRTSQTRTPGDRERVIMPEHIPTNVRPSDVPPTLTDVGNPPESSRYEQSRLAWQASIDLWQDPSTEARAAAHRQNLETLRRRYLENPSNKVTEFERIIKYLHVLRTPDAESENRMGQREGPMPMDKGHSWDKATGFKSHHACPPQYTSWLSSGMLFEGTQQASPVVHFTPSVSSSTTLRRLVHHQSMGPPWNSLEIPPVSSFDASRPWLTHTMSSAPLTFSTSPPPTTATTPSMNDRWTVKVELHNVDYANMTLQGTMEAYNVPSWIPNSNPSPNVDAESRKTTFSTYLEGELIDFAHHTLLTEPEVFDVKTTPDVDAAYWRRLEPFSLLTDEEIARALLDRTWMEEKLMGRYVLMRWKERCFVKPTHGSSSSFSGRNAMSDGHTGVAGSPGQTTQPRPGATTSFLSGADGNGYGLSISGFYYVSLRRSDGRLEGLYFDPQSSPYQHLEMRPSEGMKCGRGSWEFR